MSNRNASEAAALDAFLSGEPLAGTHRSTLLILLAEAVVARDRRERAVAALDAGEPRRARDVLMEEGEPWRNE